MTLSIVIPARDEARKIERDVQAAGQFLGDHFVAGEIIVVDDGSSDDTADRARQTAIPQGISLIVIRNDRPRGKGFAIRTGMLASHCEYAMFADSGLTVPFENALRGMQMLKEGTCDMAHGSRKLKQSVIRKRQDWDRRLISRLFRWTVMHLMQIPPQLTDTQCGFKIYRGETARILYGECVTDGFMFDIELIVRALRDGLRIAEFPVEWRCDRDSRLSLMKSPWKILRDLLSIRRTVLR